MKHTLDSSKTVLQKDTIWGRQLADLENVEYVYLQLGEAEQIPPHEMPMDVDFFVVKGHGNILVNDNSIILEEGDLIHVEKGSSRSVYTDKSQKITLLVIKHK